MVVKRHERSADLLTQPLPSKTIKTLPGPPSSVLRLHKHRKQGGIWICYKPMQNHRFSLRLLKSTKSPDLPTWLATSWLVDRCDKSKTATCLVTAASSFIQTGKPLISAADSSSSSPTSNGGTHNDCRFHLYLRKGKISITVHLQVQFQHQNKHQNGKLSQRTLESDSSKALKINLKNSIKAMGPKVLQHCMSCTKPWAALVPLAVLALPSNPHATRQPSKMPGYNGKTPLYPKFDLCKLYRCSEPCS